MFIIGVKPVGWMKEVAPAVTGATLMGVIWAKEMSLQNADPS